MNDKIIERIDKHKEKANIIKVYTYVEDEMDGFTGIPILRSQSLLAIHQLSDFHFNGYIFIRLQDVIKVRRSRFEVTQQKILKATGEIKKHANPSWFRLGSWKSLLTCLKNKNICVSVSSALIEVNVFAIGEIHRLNKNSVVLKSFDANGEWCKPKHNIKYTDITEVEFGDEYSSTFHEYVENS